MRNFNEQRAVYNQTVIPFIQSEKKTLKSHSKGAVSFLHCQNREDKIIRNLWFSFVLTVFVFLTVLWYLGGDALEAGPLMSQEFFKSSF
jgi:hypothetical protein